MIILWFFENRAPEVWSLLKFAVCRTLCGHHSKVVAYLNLTAYSKIITVDLVCLWWHITLSSLIVRSHSHRATVSSLEQERFQGTLESWRGTHHSSSVGSWFHARGGNRKNPLDEFQTDSQREVFSFYYTELPLFWHFWKCQVIWLRSGKSREKGPKSGEDQGICVVREIWLWYLNKIAYL